MEAEDYNCSCGGTFQFTGKEEFNDYFSCIMLIFRCDKCNYRWDKIKEE